MNQQSILPLILVLLLAGCVSTPEIQPDTSCRSGTTLIDAHFDTGQIGTCSVEANGDFSLVLFPEDEPPINRSPWFAYRVSGTPGDRVTIKMQFKHGYARYWPKLSLDRENWQLAAESQVVETAEDRMELTLQLAQAWVWVAGQEILGAEYYVDRLNQLAAHPEIETRFLGDSIEGRPIYLLQTTERPELILLLGRQHPPEVTGAIAMRKFVDTVLGDSDLASRFRQRFMLGIVPLVNPDGVAGGHWRHNVGGVDLNRDWGPFTQPETTAVIRWVRQQEETGRPLRLVLDFHSTWEDLFYTQPAETDPPDFASIWLAASAERLPDFPFKHAANPVSDQPNSKNYFYKSRGIPAVTYEAGDETLTEPLETAAEVFAEEMMKVMLDTPVVEPAQPAQPAD